MFGNDKSHPYRDEIDLEGGAAPTSFPHDAEAGIHITPCDIASPTRAWRNAFNGSDDDTPLPISVDARLSSVDRQVNGRDHVVSSTRFFSPLNLLRRKDIPDMNPTCVDAEDALSDAAHPDHIDMRISMPMPHSEGDTAREASQEAKTYNKRRTHIVPPSTLYPSSLPLDDRHENERLTADSDQHNHDGQAHDTRWEKDKDYAIRAIREGLGWLPAEVLAGYSNDELKELIVSAIERTAARDAPDVHQNPSSYSDQANSSSSVIHERPEPLHYFSHEECPAPHPSAQEWYESMTGGALPAGWAAEYDYDQQAWYFINYNELPPWTTWHDPRANVSAQNGSNYQPPMAAPLSEPVVSLQPEELARWYADSFARFEAFKQAQQGGKGPVEAEMRSERRRVGRLHRAQALIEEATRRLRDAALGPVDKDKVRERKAAEVDLARAQGMMDRIKAEDAARSAMLPPWLSQYQGSVHGYDAVQGATRTHFVDAPFGRAPQSGAEGQQVSESANVSARSTGAVGLVPSIAAPALPQFPLPRLGRASTVPTPYGIPEACFAWDMLLRSTAPTTKLAAKPTRRDKKLSTIH